jgi:DNA modification methylase
MAKTTTIDIANVQTDPNNAREHDEANMAAIQKSLDRFGPGRSIVLDGTDTVRAGNGTVEAARAAGFGKVLVVEPEPDTLVAVRRPEWSEQEAAGYAIADNRAAELAKWDVPQLQSVIDSIPDIDLGDIGFAQDQFDELIKGASDSLDGTGDVNDDEVPDPPNEPVTKPGDVWTLGRHILVCGDCCEMMQLNNPAIANAAIVLTDPPYAVDYQRSADFRGNASAHEGYVDPDSASTALAFLDHVACDVVVMTFPVDRHFFALADALRKNRFEFRKELVWVKDRFSFWPGSKYQQQHESILLIARKGRPLNSNPPANESTVINAPMTKSHDKHPTARPPALWANLLCYHTEPGATVVDPYLGSGTTLVVAEQSNRICVGSEISPVYCDVIVERWQNLTGGKAKRETS